MLNSQQSMDNYLSSKCGFEMYLEYYLLTFNHMGECVEKATHAFRSDLESHRHIRINNLALSFYDDVYKTIQQRKREESGFHLRLNDSIITSLNRKNYSNRQLFCVVFSYWYGLGEQQIACISDELHGENCEEIL